MPRFETFTKTLAARSREPHATIQKRGTIALNAAAFAALDSPDAVELLFDVSSHTVGLRPCATDVAHASFVRPATRSPNGPFVVSAMAFLHHYAVDTSEARRWPLVVDGGIGCVRLDEPCEVVSKSRAHAS